MIFNNKTLQKKTKKTLGFFCPIVKLFVESLPFLLAQSVEAVECKDYISTEG